MSPTASPRLSPALQQTLWALGFTTADAALQTAQLTAFVRHHDVAGLLDSQRLAALDEASREALTRERRQIALRALQLGAALKRLRDALQAQGLEPLALKGPALALQAHGNLDLLLRDHWQLRWRALRDWLSPTATDHHWLQLPNSLRLLYPLVRLYRLVARSR